MMLSDEEIKIETQKELEELLEKRRERFDLGEDHIAGVTVDLLSDKTSAAIIKLSNTKLPLISTYIAIAYNEDKGLRYFTLERSLSPDDDEETPYIFCAIFNSLRGSYKKVKNNRKDFTETVRLAMESR